MTPILVSQIATPFGGFLLASRDGAFIATQGPNPGLDDPLGWGAWRWDDVRPAAAAHDEAHRQIETYFDGSLRAFTLPLSLDGDTLQRDAWAAAQAIPYGRARTYGAIAEEIGLPGRARAVGRAMAICPVSLLVPLHRVVGAGERRCGELESWQRRMRLLTFEREMIDPRMAAGMARRSGRGRSSGRAWRS